MVDFKGSGLYQATVRAIWPEIGQVQVVWNDEYPISGLPISYLKQLCDAGSGGLPRRGTDGWRYILKPLS
eukprot:12428188-Karenia_brevis.AAC.1